jgi:hypothetical protein
MKKATILLCASMAFYACKTDRDDTITPLVPSPTAPAETLKLSFVKTNTGHDLGNLQAGDVITFKYETSASLEDGKLSIVPEITDKTKHQIIGKDFGLSQNDKPTDSIKLTKNTGEFNMQVHAPGAFQNNLQLLKRKNNAYAPLAQAATVFNVVQIIAYRYAWEARAASFWNNTHSIQTIRHKLFIKTGEEQNDNFLNGLSFQMKFAGRAPWFNNFQKSTNIDFVEFQDYEGGTSPAIAAGYINTINFVKEVNGIKTNIEYNGISVQDFGGDAWRMGEAGGKFDW